MAYADIMAKVRPRWKRRHSTATCAAPLAMLIALSLCFFQSCHVDEEEEGDEPSAEDEMSFEVRQSELVMGGEGQGTRNTAER